VVAAAVAVVQEVFKHWDVNSYSFDEGAFLSFNPFNAS